MAPPNIAPVGYNISWPVGQGATPCPAPSCRYIAKKENLLRRHFATQHPGDSFRNRSDVRFNAPCVRCGMQVTPNNCARGHLTSQLCTQLHHQRERARRLRAAQEAQSSTVFSALGVELEAVHEFRYLGRVLSDEDSDWPALQRNLTRARQRWAMISRLLAREGANPKVSGYFYKAVVQSVLLYGSETWVWSQRMRSALQGFHNKVARRLTGLRPRLHEGAWTVPPIAEALEASGLHPIEEYITRRRETLKAQVVGRPIYQICMQTQRMPGTPTNTQVWWEQFTVDNPFII